MPDKKWTLKTFIKKIAKITGWTILSILVLLVAAILIVRIPAVQRKIVQEVVALAGEKLGTPVSVKSVTLAFPKKVVVTDLYVADQATDTLLFVHELSVATDLWALLHHSIQLNSVEISGLHSYISRPAGNGPFNFDYIVKKFQDTTAVTSPDTTATPWKFTVGEVVLTKTAFHYHDNSGGDQANLRAGLISVVMQEFDPAASVFKVNSIRMADVKGSVLQTKSPAPSAPSGDTTSITTGINTVTLENIHVSWEQRATGQLAQLDLGTLSLDVSELDLTRNTVHLKQLAIENTHASYRQTSAARPSTPPAPAGKSGVAAPWDLALGNLDLSNISLQYYDYTQAVKQNRADFSHLWVSQFSAQVKNIAFRKDNYSAEVQHLTFSERNGLQLQELRGKFGVTNRAATLTNFLVRTKRSTVALNGTAVYSSLSGVNQDWPKIIADLELKPSVIAVSDVAYFAPDMLRELPVKIPATALVRVEGNVSGKINALTLDNFSLRTLDNTHLRASGTVKGLPDFKHALLNIRLDSFHTTRHDAGILLPDSLLPASVTIPDWLTLKGELKGTLRNAYASAALTTNLGIVGVHGRYALDSAGVGAYHGRVTVQNVAVGKILRQDSIGNLTMAARINGSGTTLKTLNADISLVVSEFEYQHYTYHDFIADGTIQNYFYTGKASLKDKNLEFELSGELDYRADVPLYVLKADLKNADFKALHLSARPLRTRGTLDVKLATPDFQTINGSLSVHNVAIFNGETLYKVDSLLFASIDTEKETDISIHSDLIDGSFKGTIHLVSLPEVLKRHFNTYFSLNDTAYSKPVAPQNFEFSLTLKKTDLITEILLPSLKSFESSPITGRFNSLEKKLDIHAKVTRFRYDNLKARSIELNINSTKKALTYGLALENFRYDSLKIPGLSFEGTVANDSIRTKLIVLDSVDKQKYLLGAVFNSLKDDFQFRFMPGQVFLNYEEWTVPDDNYIRFEKQRMRANNFSIRHDQEKILMETKGKKDSVIQIGFRQLDLKNIFSIVSGSAPIASGQLDGDISLFLNKNGAFNAAVKIRDLAVMHKDWGQVELAANRISTNKFDLTLTSKGEHTDIIMKGDYVTEKPESILHLNADIKKLDLELIEPLSSGQVKKASGGLHGQLDISGTIARPVIKGDLVFADASFTSSYVNTVFTLKNETLRFTGSGLTLNNFTIRDDAQNTAVFRGSINTKTYRDFDLNLSLTTRNFRILNTTADNNQMYFGKVKMNASATVKGPLTQPVVDVKMGFTNDTEFSYIIPANSKGVIETNGIVEFVDKHPSKDPFLSSLALKDTVQNIVKGLDLTATITLTSDEKLNIIIDPKSGDKLSVQGSTVLLVKIDPSGNMNLTGQFEIAKGSYNFSFYKLVHRDFEILRGGTIVWSGDPMDAKLNLQALYKIETSPLELLSLSPGDLSATKQAYQSFPFLVYLNIDGELSAPEINFRLDMPEGSKSALGGNVYAAIQSVNSNEPDLNKQVFSLLVLRRFMATNPFENQVTTSFSSNARSSVSGLLSDQLQRLSSNIKGVQLSVDLKSFDDYTTGTANNQTKLQLGVSKSLLHDKLVVKLAGNVDIAGENTNQSSLTDYIGDLALEYKITSDGRLRLTGFRNSDYDMIDGELIKTGAGLIYIKDYNTLSELFKSNAKTGN